MHANFGVGNFLNRYGYGSTRLRRVLGKLVVSGRRMILAHVRLKWRVSVRYVDFSYCQLSALTSAGSERDVSTSEDSCFSVCVRFREASARARVSRVGFAAAVGSHLHNADAEVGELDDETGDEDVHACTEVDVNEP
jgi:hypothetical protein